MKKYIVLLLSVMLFACGCDDGELVDINKSGEYSHTGNQNDMSVISSEADGKTVDISDKEAGNNGVSRPLVVYVCGEVRKPGVYELDEGSRILDAIMAAGGYTKDAGDDYLNLACMVSDGDKVYVPSKEEIENGSAAGLDSGIQNASVTGSGNSTQGGLININTATAEELMTLPGIGASKAEKIIAYREQNGRFSAIEDIMQISGIKEGMFNKIKDRICVR